MNGSQSLWPDDGEENRVLRENGGKQKGKISAEQRDMKVTALLEKFFEKALQHEYEPLDAETQQEVELLFATSILGYREILLVIVIACMIDKTFKASEDFYKCNPRALFEGPIRKELLAHKIPQRGSGPLNIAKGTSKINDQWAARRRPRNVAIVTVRLVQKIESMSDKDLENFAINLHVLFLKAQEISAGLNVEANPQADPDYLYNLSKTLIDSVPDGGNTPQRIIGYLLQAYHETLKTGINVSGHEDRASTTNRTSKKIGDIVEERTEESYKQIFTVYEVTVKEFAEKRVMEATEAYLALSTSEPLNEVPANEIIVLCREKDKHPDVFVSTSGYTYLGKLEQRKIVFYYQNIYEWIIAQLLRMPTRARLQFYEKLHAYIQHPNTDEKVRSFWKQLHQEALE